MQPALGLHKQDRHTCCLLSPGVLITAYQGEGALAPFPILTAPSLRERCGAPLLKWRPWPLPPNKCDGKHHPSPSLGPLLLGGKETTLVCSRPPTSCFLPEKPPLIMPSGGLLGGPPGHSDASSFLCLLQLCLGQAWHPLPAALIWGSGLHITPQSRVHEPCQD